MKDRKDCPLSKYDYTQVKFFVKYLPQKILQFIDKKIISSKNQSKHTPPISIIKEISDECIIGNKR